MIFLPVNHQYLRNIDADVITIEGYESGKIFGDLEIFVRVFAHVFSFITIWVNAGRTVRLWSNASCGPPSRISQTEACVTSV